MSLTFFLKNNLNKLPVGVELGRYISKIPYKYRPGIGKSYHISQKVINKFNNPNFNKNEYILNQVNNILKHAYLNTKFYKKYYDDCAFDIKSIRNIGDISKIPIVSKSILNEYNLEYISYNEKGRFLSNTGGSSGSPFHFYTSASAIGHEWAHIHYMWRRLGFRHDMLKLNFYGRSNVKNILDYDLIRHSLISDIYADFDLLSQKILDYANKNKIRYLHGYPSSLYEFACYCENNDILRSKLSSSLNGAFLSSEFPHDRYRDKIESVFNIKTQAFYGHTERCIMAYEVDRLKYKVLQTYGYAEIEDNKLIGTSYHGFATPLIRYDTGDTVTSVEYSGDLLDCFIMKDGRSGEFIMDLFQKEITLTGLLFGRHHEIFNYITNIQIVQEVPGEAKILYCLKNDVNLNRFQVEKMFDSSNVNIVFEFIEINKPIKTISGKVQLRVDKVLYDENI
ncbi:TPA: hypothetical protein ACX6RO_003430 [Photobacterium damselae]